MASRLDQRRVVVAEEIGGPHAFRRPQRLTITVSWHLYETLMQQSGRQGRSLSNLAAYWLERQAEDWRDDQAD